MRDLYHNLKVTQLAKPATQTNSVTSASADRMGHESLAIVFHVGQSGDTLSGSVKWTLSLEESNDNAAFTAVSAEHTHNGTASIVIDDATKDETAYTLGYAGNKRYVRALAAKAGTHSNGTPIGITALLGHPHKAPVA